jgi:replication-associated recombination protein RarA
MTSLSASEVLRPTELVDLVQPDYVVARFERMVSDRNLMNMLFYGQPGVGKTSAARLLLKKIDMDVYEVNGSIKTGIDQVRDEIEKFCTHYSIYGQPKACFIDECEFLSASAQAGLRGVIEKFREVRFILTANDIIKLHPALKSRCMPISFDPSPLQAEEIISRIAPRYHLKLEDAGLEIGDKALREILFTEFPDLRRVANRLEFEALPRQPSAVLNGTTDLGMEHNSDPPSISHPSSNDWSTAY